MNIYLDIDGVLLANENHAVPYADEEINTVVLSIINSSGM